MACKCHEHENEHEHCHDGCCEHEHREHHHDHCHDDHCGCHEHGGHCHEGCACHGGKDSDEIKKDLILIGICAAVFAFSFLPFVKPFALWICLLVTVVAGREVLKEGFEDLLRFHFGEETLMSIAVVSAFLIGEYV
ncbi:MAG: hypothetical protein IIU57_06025, partial [Oscillospiraceae bacterium]|nr:hypothetical protein [Oscillospiraceae bacterium]